MLDFDSLAASFNRQYPLTIYCAVRRPSNDLESMVYPAWLIKEYGEPFDESRSESVEGSIEQVLLFSDCVDHDAWQAILDPWRCEAEKAGAEVIRRGLASNQGFLHSETVEWVLACIQHVPRSKTDFIDQDEFDIGKGLVTTLRNAWVTSDEVCRQLAKGEVPTRDAAGGEAIGNPCNPTNSRKTKRLPTNNRMIEYLQKKPEATNYSARQWAAALDVSTSTIHATKTWKSLNCLKELAGKERLERQSNKIDENPNGKKNPKRDKPL